MEFLKLAAKRHSVRKYNDAAVEPEKIDMILEAGRIAPTAANRQPIMIYAVQGKEGLDVVRGAANFFGAPLVFVVCGDKKTAWQRSYDGMIATDIDSSIVTDHMMLEATELGLGSVWICKFDPVVLKKGFGMPEALEPVNILAVGYSDDAVKSPDRHDTQRKTKDELVTFI